MFTSPKTLGSLLVGETAWL